MKNASVVRFVPVAAAALATVLLVTWWWPGRQQHLQPRVPGTDQPPGEAAGASNANPVLRGALTRSDGQPADLPGAWPQFRGPGLDGISHEPAALAREWNAGLPRPLWGLDVGEGYGGAAVLAGRVYLMDYDREKQQDALRCLSLRDGREIWRFSYPVQVKRNHGMSRTIPTVSSNLVVAMGPKCHVVCADALTGELRWGLDLVRQFGTTIPPWYTGQCPLLDEGRVILAPGGRQALLLQLELSTGKVLWQTPNPKGWKMTHASVVPMTFAGQRLYLYCASGGVVAVSARDGSILWDTSEWKISIATVPSPVVLDGGRLFLSGGYDAGSLMLQLKEEAGKITSQTLFRLKPDVFGATQHTPIYHDGFLYGVRPSGEFVCLAPDGQIRWTSGAKTTFGLGPFLLAQGLIYALEESGKLRLIEANPAAFRLFAEAQVLNGHEAWAPLALAGTRLLARDLTRMVCLEVGTGR
jgi:outer membrane protein assembly factor BamB